MGLKYCRPIASIPKIIEPYQKLTLLDIKSKLGNVIRDYQLKGIYFITHDILRDILHMMDEQIYLFEDLYAVNRDLRRINSLDFWCSLALCSVGGNEEKIAFCFSQIDGNTDGYVSFNELFVLFTCATRGVARLKGLQAIPLENIDRLITNAFKMSLNTLQNGEISLSDLSSYLLTDDLCRTYLSALGAKLPPVDAAAIVLKRANLLREITSIRYQCDDILCEIDELEGEISNFTEERAGESALLSLQQQNIDAISKIRYTPTPLTTAEDLRQQSSLITKDTKYSDIKDSNLLDWNHPANKYYNTDDIWIYQVYDLRKKPSTAAGSFIQTSKSMPNLDPSSHSKESDSYLRPPIKKGKSFSTIVPVINIYTTAFETILWKEWEKVPHDADQLIPLDEFTLMAIFDRVSIVLTYHEAKECLQTIPKSQLKKYSFQDVLHWFRYAYNSFPIYSLNPYYVAWFEWMQSLSQSYHFMKKYSRHFFFLIEKQRRVISGVNQDNETFAKKLATIRNLSARKPASIQIRYNVNGIQPNNPQEEISFNTIPENSNAWKTKIKVVWTTNPFTNMSTKRSKGNSRIQVITVTEPILANPEGEARAGGKESKEEVPVEEINEKKTSVPTSPSEKNETLADLFRISASQEEEELKKQLEEARKNRPKHRIIKKSSYLLINDYPNLQASDILDYYNRMNEEEFEKLSKDPQYQLQRQQEILNKSKQSTSAAAAAAVTTLATQPKSYSSVTWFTLEMKPQLPYSQMILLKESVKQFFEAIPIEYHENWYEEVKVEICVIEEKGLDAKEFKNDPTRKKNAMSLVEMLFRTLSKERKEEAALLSSDEEKDEYLYQPKVLLISLLHETDLFLQFEQYLIASLDLYLSRIVHYGSIEIQLMQSLVDLFTTSLSQYSIDQKLFGPQEQELIEKNLINPLAYAKEIRQIKKQYQEIITNVQEKKYTKEELSHLCKNNGYSAQGTSYTELADRIRSIYELKLELLNYGELNTISRQLLGQIFHQFHQMMEKNKYSREADSNWKLWEFNEFLYATGIQTVYNKSEYEKFLVQHGLYMDNEKQMSLASLQAYYERIGHLYEDLLQWKICNLDSQITGKVTAMLLYDSSALSLLLSSYYDQKPVYIPSFMKELIKLMMIKEYNVDKNVNSISEIIEDLLPLESLQPPSGGLFTGREEEQEREDRQKENFFKKFAGGGGGGFGMNFDDEEEQRKQKGSKVWKEKLLQMFSFPGEFARVISQMVGHWNHGKEGLLPLLRKFLYEEFIIDSHLLIHQQLPKYVASTAPSSAALSPDATNRSPIGSVKSGGGKSVDSKNLNQNSQKNTARPNSQQGTHRSAFSQKEVEIIPEKDVTLLDSITIDPVTKKSETKPNEENNDDHDDTVYYDTEEEEEAENADIRQRIIFDELFTYYYLHEYQYQLNETLKQEDEKRVLVEKQRAAREAALQQMEELAKKEKEKEAKNAQLLLEGIINKEEESNPQQAELIAKLLQAVEQQDEIIIVLTDEEVQEKVSHQLAQAFLRLQPNLLRQSQPDRPTSRNDLHESDSDPQQQPEDQRNINSNERPNPYSSSFTSSIPNQSWKKLKDQIISDLIFLYQVRNINGMNITLEESNLIEQKKISLFQTLQEISQLEYQHSQHWTKSLVMMYDCIRLFTTDLAHIGIGTKDVCLRFYQNNLYTNNRSNQLCTFLPKGVGELSPIEEYEKQKLQRYINRKMKALAAIERERMRRTMTEEEKETIRYQKLLAQKQSFIQEEKGLFDQAMSLLLSIRENTVKKKEEISQMIQCFEEIVKLKEDRFPDEFQTQIARNNIACLLYEFYGIEHPAGEPAQYFLQEACENIVKLGYDGNNVEDSSGNNASNANKNNQPNGAIQIPLSLMSVDHTSTSSIPSTIINLATPIPHQTVPNQLPHIPDDSSTIHTIDEHSELQLPPPSSSCIQQQATTAPNPPIIAKIAHPLAKAMIMINYIYILQRTESFTQLKQSTAIKSFLMKCYQQLTNPEKHKLRNAVISEVENIAVFHLHDLMIPKKQINHINTILDMCQKEYDYLEKQLALVAGGAASSSVKMQPALSYSLDSLASSREENDDMSAISDIHSVASQNKKKSSKKKKKKSSKKEGNVKGSDASLEGGGGDGGGVEEQGDGEGDDSASESNKRRLERENKQLKYLEQRRKDQALRQEISRQRNKLYTLIQTNQISEIFDRKASKISQLAAPKWENSKSSKVTSSATSAKASSDVHSTTNTATSTGREQDEEDHEEAEEKEFLELARGMANHTVI